MVETTSDKGSLKGWSLWKWLYGNLKTIKEMAKAGLPLIAGMYFFTENPALIGTVTILGKMGFDTLEYWLKEYITV